MRTHEALIILLVVPLTSWVGCSGKTSGNEPPVSLSTGGTGGGTGGSAGSAASCPPDTRVATGLEPCRAAMAGCGTGACYRVYDQWQCATGCPCTVNGFECRVVEGTGMCVPPSVAACLDEDGGSGGTGTGGGGSGGGTGGGPTGGYGGVGGSSGFGGTGAMGGGGSGGTGPCNGNPSCNGTPISFCTEDGSSLLSCSAGYDCPAVTECTSLCPGCGCHMVPPVNGKLDGTCDTCTNNSECGPGLVCGDNPMYPGSGAKTCVMGP